MYYIKRNWLKIAQNISIKFQILLQLTYSYSVNAMYNENLVENKRVKGKNSSISVFFVSVFYTQKLFSIFMMFLEITNLFNLNTINRYNLIQFISISTYCFNKLSSNLRIRM